MNDPMPKYVNNQDGTISLIETVNETKADDVVNLVLLEALETLRAHKPNNLSELDRRYAVTITKMEDVFAYYHTFIFENTE